MEERKQIKISLKMFIVILLTTITICALIVFLLINNINNKKQDEGNIFETVEVKKYKNEEYHIIKGDYSGEYDLQFVNLSQYFDLEYSKLDEIERFKKKEVMSYDQYKSYCNEWGFEKVYSDTSKNYLVFSYIAYYSPILEARLADVKYSKDEANMYIWDYSAGETVDISAYCIVVPTEKEIEEINIIPLYTNEEFKNIKENYNQVDSDRFDIKKPVIYLYPTQDTDVSVKLGYKEKIIVSYPKYIDGWDVLAKPNGDLKDLETGRNLYALYYESENVVPFKIENEGFIVKGEDSAEFLEEKLAVLGLTEREAEEFIIYWLPKLESNKYNYIRFATEDEINKNMPLEINPAPDTLIRVIMTFKGLEYPIDVEEQKLNNVERKGFTVVEWGGTEIK